LLKEDRTSPRRSTTIEVQDVVVRSATVNIDPRDAEIQQSTPTPLKHMNIKGSWTKPSLIPPEGDVCAVVGEPVLGEEGQWFLASSSDGDGGGNGGRRMVALMVAAMVAANGGGDGGGDGGSDGGGG
jgi:hypothetical protein